MQSAKFPPWGRRGFGSPLAMERFSPAPSMTEYLQQANDSLLTIVQIETREALESIDEIAAVEGIDALFIGPFDLGQFMPSLEPCTLDRFFTWRRMILADRHHRKQHWPPSD